MSEQRWSDRLEELAHDAGQDIDPRGSIALVHWAALKAWADERQAAGKPLPQDNPRKTERAHPIYVCAYCKNPKNESDLLVGETLCVEGDKCKRISELEAQLAEASQWLPELQQMYEVFRPENSPKNPRESRQVLDNLRSWLAAAEQERDSLRAYCNSCNEPVGHTSDEHTKWKEELPPPVAPEAAEPQATPITEAEIEAALAHGRRDAEAFAAARTGQPSPAQAQVEPGRAQTIGKISDSLPTSAEDERVVDELMAKRAERLENAQQKAWMPAEGETVRVFTPSGDAHRLAQVLRITHDGQRAECRLVGSEPAPGSVYPSFALGDLCPVELADYPKPEAPTPDVERLRRLEEWLEREAQSPDSDHPDRAPAYALVLAMLKEALGGKPAAPSQKEGS